MIINSVVQKLTIKSKVSSVAGPFSSMFKNAWAVMTSTVLAATVLGHSSALIGFSELMHSTQPVMHFAALKTPATASLDKYTVPDSFYTVFIQ